MSYMKVNLGMFTTWEVYCKYPGLSNTPSNVVKRLLDSLHREGRTLKMDNYYQCPVFALDLLLENTKSVGTVCANRVGMPTDITTGNFVQGQMDYRRQGHLICVRWMDKRAVHMLTTTHLPTMKLVTTRTGEKKTSLTAIMTTLSTCLE